MDDSLGLLSKLKEDYPASRKPISEFYKDVSEGEEQVKQHGDSVHEWLVQTLHQLKRKHCPELCPQDANGQQQEHQHSAPEENDPADAEAPKGQSENKEENKSARKKQSDRNSRQSNSKRRREASTEEEERPSKQSRSSTAEDTLSTFVDTAIREMKVAYLKDCLGQVGLPKTGRKCDLAKRLADYFTDIEDSASKVKTLAEFAKNNELKELHKRLDTFYSENSKASEQETQDEEEKQADQGHIDSNMDVDQNKDEPEPEKEEATNNDSDIDMRADEKPRGQSDDMTEELEAEVAREAEAASTNVNTQDQVMESDTSLIDLGDHTVAEKEETEADQQQVATAESNNLGDEETTCEQQTHQNGENQENREDGDEAEMKEEYVTTEESKVQQPEEVAEETAKSVDKSDQEETHKVENSVEGTSDHQEPNTTSAQAATETTETTHVVPPASQSQQETISTENGTNDEVKRSFGNAIDTNAAAATTNNMTPATQNSSNNEPSSNSSQRVEATKTTQQSASSSSNGVTPKKRPEDNYEISDNDDDSDDENVARRQKPIPDWARGKALEDALHKQFGPDGPDPDAIFEDVTDCDLEAIFPVTKKRFKVRTSSGHWLPDKLTEDEKKRYRVQMGFD